ncbi:MAG: amidohydrolase family protein [Bacillota bacterium]
MVVVDFHTHAGLVENLQQWFVQRFSEIHKKDMTEILNYYSTPAGRSELLAESGADYQVILAEMTTTGSVTNEFVAGLCRQAPGTIPFANLNLSMDGRPAATLEYCVKELGCRGLKMQPTYQHFYPNEPSYYPIWARAEELGIPVMFHTGSSVFPGAKAKYGQPILLDDLAVDFPDLKIIMAHSGRGFWYQEAFFLARNRPNVYMEVSGLPPKKLLNYFPDLERIADKVIFGSDWPEVTSIRDNINQIKALPISEAAKEKILGKNALKVLGMEG